MCAAEEEESMSVKIVQKYFRITLVCTSLMQHLLNKVPVLTVVHFLHTFYCIFY